MPNDTVPATRSTVALTLVITLLTVAAMAAGFLAFRFHGQTQDLQRANADRARAEDIAGKYGVAAATLSYQDLAPWLKGLRTGVSDELATRWDGVAETLRQVLVPLQLESTGSLISAKVNGEAKGVYQVVTVVDVAAKSVQAPQGTVTTSAYTMSVDSNLDWKITAVGNPTSGSALPIPGGIAPTTPAPSAAAPTP